MDIQDMKQACRRAGFANRKEAHAMGLDKEANGQLLSFLKQAEPDQVIAAYMPIRTEVSPLLAMKKMVSRGNRVCVPVILGEGQPLEFHEWTPETEMVEGMFGAAIPKKAEVLLPDIVVTPLLAFDLEGYRMGYGGGFYDRTFEKLSEIKKVLAIGYAYSEQEVMIVPREETDYKLNAVVTEKGILTF